MLRVTMELLGDINAAAKDSEMNITDWIRLVLKKATKKYRQKRQSK